MVSNQQKLILLLESVQRLSTKFILQDYDSDYEERLIKLELLPLCYRREYLDLIFIFKSLQGLNSYCIETIAVFNDDVYLRSGDVNNLASILPIPRTEAYLFK